MMVQQGADIPTQIDIQPGTNLAESEDKMGVYSWKDCKNYRRRVICGKKEESFLLIPAEFGGGHYVTPCYSGYGTWAGKDVYEQVALWNRAYIDPKEQLKRAIPERERYAGLWDWDKEKMREQGATEEEIHLADEAERDKWYQAAVRRYEFAVKRLADFAAGMDDAEMREKYGDDYLREIGIDIACYDEDNFKLKYPIKITFDTEATYESCKRPSKSDPMQGCY